MDIIGLAHAPSEKIASRALWRLVRRPLLGAERAAPGAERGFGQMSAKTEGWVGNEASRSGMSRDTHNEILNKWWGTPAKPNANKALVEDYMRLHPEATPFMQASPQLKSTFKQFEEGTGKYQHRASMAKKIEAQKARDLQHSFSGFGKDQQSLVDIQGRMNKLKELDVNYNMPGAVVGAGAGGYAGYKRDGSLQSTLTGAALGATVGVGAGKGLTRLTRQKGVNEYLGVGKAMQKDIASRHGKGLMGQKLKYMGRRVTDPILQRGRFDSLGERLRYGKLGGGHIFGKGYELIKARAAQGGLLGKGGLVRGGLALDPRIGMNYKLMRHALSQGQYGQAARLGKDLAVGSAIQTGKVGLMGAMPAHAVYSEMSDPNAGHTGSFASRLGRSVGSNVGGVAMFPMGMLTWAPSMIPGLESMSLGHQIGNMGAVAGNYVSPSGGGVATSGVGDGYRRNRSGKLVRSYMPSPAIPGGQTA